MRIASGRVLGPLGLATIKIWQNRRQPGCMFEILIVAIAILFLAKHTGRRNGRRYNLRKVRITPELALATLASDTAVTVTTTGTSDSQYRCISILATWALRGLTAGDGPVTVGYAHGDYTVAEIKECLESTNAISQGDKIAGEKTNRLVRIVGTFGTAGPGILNDGRPIKTRLNWAIMVGEQVNMFAFNEDTAALTTGSVLHCQGSMFVKDAS